LQPGGRKANKVASPRLLEIYPGLIYEGRSFLRFGRDKKEMPPAGFKHRDLDFTNICCSLLGKCSKQISKNVK